MHRMLIAGLAIVSGIGSVPGPVEEPVRLEAPGIENLFRLSPRLLSGGQPKGEEAFQTLAELGVKTIVSVDGQVPDLDRARQYGLRYIHLPVGYDGIPSDRALALAKVAKEAKGPIYLHCHHGKHRGPAAAAICGMVAEGWDHERARNWLERAGTSADYAGLYTSIETFTPPSAIAIAALTETDLPEQAEVPDLVEGMVGIDLRWEHVKTIADAGFRVPDDHPDLDPSHEATLLAEHYRELARLDESKERGDAFLALLRQSERNALTLRDALRPSVIDREAATTAFQAAANDCKSCHSHFRDRLP
ncbi:protein-tyrosine phosphatase family protein [Tautonia rosea]|uniref:hypothetical protein n=1 Tax=Tautonia rosea TaxID=2728037 RepID=UPI0014755EFE|nr:hypothetical protein [Tautonia rosea]